MLKWRKGVQMCDIRLDFLILRDLFYNWRDHTPFKTSNWLAPMPSSPISAPNVTLSESPDQPLTIMVTKSVVTSPHIVPINTVG